MDPATFVHPDQMDELKKQRDAADQVLWVHFATNSRRRCLAFSPMVLPLTDRELARDRIPDQSPFAHEEAGSRFALHV
jgi:hypothetical protein